MSTPRDWAMWLLGFGAGAVLASYMTLSCTPTRAQSAEVQEAITTAADTYGVPASRLFCLARRESRYVVTAYNTAGPYVGLFQFSWRTWNWMSAQAGLAGTSPYDPYAASMVTAWALRHGYGGHWPPLRWC